MSSKKKLINNTSIPEHAIETFARCVLPDIQAFFASEEGQREFAEWKAEQAKKRAAEKSAALVVVIDAFALAWLGMQNLCPRTTQNKQIIRTHLPQGRYGSDYIALVHRKGLVCIFAFGKN